LEGGSEVIRSKEYSPELNFRKAFKKIKTQKDHSKSLPINNVNVVF